MAARSRSLLRLKHRTVCCTGLVVQPSLILQGYTNYQLDPSKGTYARVPNQAPPFMGVNPSAAGKYTSFAQAPAAAPGSAMVQQVSAFPSRHCQNMLYSLEF